jgi:hypothetical protein
MKHLKVTEGMGKFQIWYAIDPRMTRTRKDQSSKESNSFDTMKGHTIERSDSKKCTWLKVLEPSCDWRIHTMCYLIGTSSIDKGKGKTLANEAWKIRHGVEFILMELLPQESGSTRSAKIHLEVFASNVPLDVLYTNMKLMTSLQLFIK